jgi:hypothetical protein
MIERVEEGGLVRFDRMARALKLGRGAIVKRSFCDARMGAVEESMSAPTLGERERSIDTRLCRVDRGEFE